MFYVKNPILFLFQLSTSTFFYNSKNVYLSSNHTDRSILVHTMGSIFFVNVGGGGEGAAVGLDYFLRAV